MEGASERSARPGEVIATLAIVGAFVAIAAGKPIVRRLSAHPTPERCAEMLDRYAEHQAFQNNRARPSTHVAPDAPDAQRCARELTLAEIDCAMRANGADELERCLP